MDLELDSFTEGLTDDEVFILHWRKIKRQGIPTGYLLDLKIIEWGVKAGIPIINRTREDVYYVKTSEDLNPDNEDDRKKLLQNYSGFTHRHQ